MKKYISFRYITIFSILFLSALFFTNTKVKAATLPVFDNSAATITNILDDGARFGANITSVGGENVYARGFILGYSNSSFDTDFPISVYDTSAASFPAGSYSLLADSLPCGKTLYVRAIAINSAGAKKGDAKSFTTLPCSGASRYTTDLTGWAWSSNTGWLSLNCANTSGTCTNSPFKVTVDNTTGLLSGYAWSSNIGWVKFDGLSDYPVTTPQAGPAKINTTTGTTTGWIRACVGTISGDCSTMESRTDGWDGWIELSGVNHLSTQISSYVFGGVRLNINNGGILGGNAWGSSLVGWLRFYGFSFLSGALTSPTPTPTVTPEIISASCTKVKSSTGESLTVDGNITTGDSVTFTVSNPTPGGRTYNYKWYNGESITGQSASQSYTYTYNTPKTILSTWVTVIDTSASPLSQVTIQCGGKITVSDPELKLYIGDDGPSAVSATTKTVRRGGTVGLHWVNTLNVDPFTPNYYQCDPSIDNSVPSTNWNDFRDSYSISGVNGTISGLNTPKTGEFEFKITCSPTGTAAPKTPASVILKVINSSGNEF